ncbi:hypothetical protein JL722_9510 [Aureococcus anophagefferens]|nr:hypothetical protein JL722_9510 [Aureococcus anophagefferens]
MAGDVARLRQLAANGADLRSCRDPSLVELAVFCGRPEAIAALHELGAPMISEPVPLATLALLARTDAAGTGDAPVVVAVLASLRAAGADLEAGAADGESVLHRVLDDAYVARDLAVGPATSRGADARREPEFLREGWQKLGKNDSTTAARTWWTRAARHAVARWLLETGKVDPNAGSAVPALAAARCGDLAALKLLRDFGADMAKPSTIGRAVTTVAGVALMGDYRDIVKWLSKACGVAPSRADVDYAEEIKRDLGGAPRGSAAGATGARAYAVARQCAFCGRPGAKQQCGKCGSGGPRYCGQGCFKAAWKSHKKVCGTGVKKEDGEPLLVSLVSAVVSGDTAEIERLVRDERVPVDARIDHIVADTTRAARAKKEGDAHEASCAETQQGLAVGKSSSESNGAETPLLLVAFGNAGSTMTQTIFPNWSKERKKRAARTFDAAAVVRCLVGLGADLEQRTKMDKYGMTPFHLAARGGRLDVMKALAAAGADVAARAGFDGSSALGIAVMMNPASTLRALRALGCDPDQADDYGRGPLDAAISQGFVDKIECLVDLGATANWPMLWDLASTHPALAHKGPKSARRSSSASTGSRGARAASPRPPAWPRRARATSPSG